MGASSQEEFQKQSAANMLDLGCWEQWNSQPWACRPRCRRVVGGVRGAMEQPTDLSVPLLPGPQILPPLHVSGAIHRTHRKHALRQIHADG